MLGWLWFKLVENACVQEAGDAKRPLPPPQPMSTVICNLSLIVMIIHSTWRVELCYVCM